MTDHCPITELPVIQCGCDRHHRPGQTIITAAALERLAGRPMPEVRYHRQTLAEAAWQHYADHGPQTWQCPLCDYQATAPLATIITMIIRHATGSHPAHLPDRMTVSDMLTLLPTLLREAVATVDAPNPDGPPSARKADSSPAPFREVRLLRAANPSSESSLFADLISCSRVIWSAFDEVAKCQHPQPDGLGWALELGWLAKAWPDAQAYLQADDIGWVSNEVRSIVGTVAALAKVRHRPRYMCPTDGCREQMHLGDDDWMTCSAGHQHPGPRRLKREWRRKPPMLSRDLCEALRIPRGTLRWWAHEGRIKPTLAIGQQQWWLPWDAIALRYPDIVEEIERSEAA